MELIAARLWHDEPIASSTFLCLSTCHIIYAYIYILYYLFLYLRKKKNKKIKNFTPDDFRVSDTRAPSASSSPGLLPYMAVCTRKLNDDERCPSARSRVSEKARDKSKKLKREGGGGGSSLPDRRTCRRAASPAGLSLHGNTRLADIYPLPFPSNNFFFLFQFFFFSSISPPFSDSSRCS